MRAPPPPRQQSLDLMRIVAALGIVWFHMGGPGGVAFGTLSLPLFLMLTGALAVGSAARRGGLAFWRGRARRLLLPWLAWSALYLLVDALRFGAQEVLRVEDPLSLIVGPTIHLWFLPFAALASGLAVAAGAWLVTARRVRLAALVLGPLCALPVLAHDHGHLPEPFAQWAVALAPFVYGVLFAAGRARGAPRAALGFAVLVAATAWWGWRAPLAPFLPVAALLFEGLWRLPIRHPALPALGDLSCGIYLAHPLCALLWYATGGGPPALGASVVFLMSAAVAWALAALLRDPRLLSLSAAGRAGARPAPGEG